MTGCLQTYARKHMAAIDGLGFEYEVLKKEPEDITEGPEDGVYCYGLYMEGARCATHCRLLTTCPRTPDTIPHTPHHTTAPHRTAFN